MIHNLKVGYTYRIHIVLIHSREKAGRYIDVECINKQGASRIIKCFPEESENLVEAEWKIGEIIDISQVQENGFLIAKSIEDYYKITQRKEKVTIIRTKVYDDTIIDRLYNWYCKVFHNEIEYEK